MAINNSQIVQEYGAYYISEGQNEQRLKRMLLFGKETVSPLYFVRFKIFCNFVQHLIRY